MIRRDFSSAVAILSLASLASQRVGAQAFSGITDLDAGRGLRTALETGAVAAVKLLGRPDGSRATRNSASRFPAI